MTEVWISSVISGSIDRVWDVIRDFNAMPMWHPLIAQSRIETGAPSDQIGCVRYLTLTDGAYVREQLTELSDANYRFAYKILDSDLPLKNYKADLALFPVTDTNRTFAIWKASFDTEPDLVAELSTTVGQNVFQGGFDALNRRF